MGWQQCVNAAGPAAGYLEVRAVLVHDGEVWVALVKRWVWSIRTYGALTDFV